VAQTITIEISTFFIVYIIVSYLLGHKDTNKRAENQKKIKFSRNRNVLAKEVTQKRESPILWEV
jgi:hypothetical protein